MEISVKKSKDSKSHDLGVLRSEDASINQPPAEPSGVANPGVGIVTMDQVIQIITAATRQT